MASNGSTDNMAGGGHDGVVTADSMAQSSSAATAMEQAANDEMKGATNQSMALNVAFEALEHVRIANTHLEFGESADVVHQCLPCLRESLSIQQQEGAGNAATNRPVVGHRIRRLLPRNKSAPCLTCGTPVCPRHRSQDFNREDISICCECSQLFSLGFITDGANDPQQCLKQQINHTLDVYDRTLLMLRYSCRYIDEIANVLEGHTKRNNRVGLGSSATGIVSGITGVAAAATIFTPVGPPLLIASILFGGGATAAAAGSEAVNYRCEPNKMANKIIALHGIVKSIFRLAAATDYGDEDTAANPDNVGSRSNSSTRLHWTRATMNTLKPLTAGTLSAVSIVTEAREMKSVVQKIRAGSPCEKAQVLNKIKDEVAYLPETSTLAEYLATVANRSSAIQS